MSFKKRYRGHYCKVCGQIRPNEKFNGKGHKNHICKICSKIPAEQQAEKIIINNIFRLYKYSNLSRNNRHFLKKYLDDPREKVKKAAVEILELFTANSFDSENEIEYEIKPENYFDEEYGNNFTERNKITTEFEEIPF